MRDTFCPMKILLFACLALTFPVAAWAAPAKFVIPTNASVKVDVAPKARTIFARAAKLYDVTRPNHRLKTLRVAWRYFGFVPYYQERTFLKSSFEFDARGLLRVQSSDPSSPLTVIDGKNQWFVAKRDEEKFPTIYRRAIPSEVGARASVFEVLGATDIDVAWELTKLLQGSSKLSQKNVAQRVGHDISQFKAEVLAPQTFDGKICDLVRVTIRHRDNFGSDADKSYSYFTYWFARSNGALVRLQSLLTSGEGKEKREEQRTDSQITKQEFNPKFAPDTFKFTPPKGAKLQIN